MAPESVLVLGYSIALVLTVVVLVWAALAIRRAEAATKRVLATIGAFDSIARRLDATALFTHDDTATTGRHRMDAVHPDRTRYVWPAEDTPTVEHDFALIED